jgi:hypothetical protein
LAFFLNRDHLRPLRLELGDGELDGESVGSDLTDNPLADGRLRLKLGPSRRILSDSADLKRVDDYTWR